MSQNVSGITVRVRAVKRGRESTSKPEQICSSSFKDRLRDAKVHLHNLRPLCFSILRGGSSFTESVMRIFYEAERGTLAEARCCGTSGRAQPLRAAPAAGRLDREI